jgi:hypothetical protein
MNRTRKLLAAVAGGALLAGTVALTGGTPSGAAEVEVNCVADDGVQQGSATLGGNPLASDSQGVLNLIGAQADPPIPAPVSLDNPISGSVDPASVPPGSNPLDFTIELLLADTLLDGLDENGVNPINLSNMELTMSPGAGVSGPDLTVNPADASIDPGAPSFPSVTVTETYDVTAAIGDTVTWELDSAQVAVNFTVPPSETIPAEVEMTFGLSCTQTSEGAFISAIVLPPFDASGPVVDPLEAVTDEDTPVEIDLNEGISDGPYETDLSTLAIIGDPSNGTAVLGDNGIVTYTPDAGFTGEDQFAYEVCSIDVVESTTTTTEATTTTLQIPRAEGRERFCNSNIVTVTVNPVGEETTTTTAGETPPPAAPPQQVAGNFTG